MRLAVWVSFARAAGSFWKARPNASFLLTLCAIPRAPNALCFIITVLQTAVLETVFPLQKQCSIRAKQFARQACYENEILIVSAYLPFLGKYLRVYASGFHPSLMPTPAKKEFNYPKKS